MFNNNQIIVRYNESVYGKGFKALTEAYPIVPAKKIEKSWWTKMKSKIDIPLSAERQEFKTVGSTMKYCPGIYDFTNYGYIIPAWQDFQFWIGDNGTIEWTVPRNMKKIYNIIANAKNQIEPCPIVDNTTPYILKLVSPWWITTPKGTSILYQKPFYHYSNDFDVCPGVLDSDIDTQANQTANIFIRFNVRNKVIHIKAGQPLAQFIPFKRMNWKLKEVVVDKKFKDKILKENIGFTTRFNPTVLDKDSMTKYRHDDSNKKFEGDKCPVNHGDKKKK